MKKINFNYNFLFLIFLIGIALLFYRLIPTTQATNVDKVTGWAWSDTVGWISFNNCITPSNCPSPDYGVNYNIQNGVDFANLTGWAWSDNIGWIKFGGLNNFPNGLGSENVNARIYVSGNNKGELSGWARACAGTINGDCASASRTDGWDGWISLRGKSTNNSNYGVKFNLNTGDILGNDNSHKYAWGSDVIGWIDFSLVKVEGINNPSVGIYDFDVQPRCVTSSSQPVTISWRTLGMSNCDVYKNNTIFYSGILLPDGFKLTTVPATSSFYLECRDSVPTIYTEPPVNPIIVEYQPVCSTNPTDEKTPTYIER